MSHYRPHPEYKYSGLEWLPDVPEHWQKSRLKAAIASARNGDWGSDPESNPNICVRVADFNRPKLAVELSNEPTMREYDTKKITGRTLLSGDLLIEKSGGGEKQLVGAVVHCGIESEGAMHSNFTARIQVAPGFVSRFLVYVFAATYHVRLNLRSIKQATGIQNLDSNQYFAEPWYWPHEEEQSQISHFLDRETTRIDTLIEKKTRFIELLKEKRAAVITHAVTKGLDPNVPMKDSGVEWLGRIPAHWQVLRVASLFREVTRPADPALPVLSVSIHDGVTDDELADEDRDRRVTLSEDRTKYQGVTPGDLVYNMMRAWQGAFGAVAVDGLVSPAYVVAAPMIECRTKFIEHLLHTKSAAEEIRRFSRGIADFRMRLYWDHFRNLRICLPSLTEQDRILQDIEGETVRIDGLISLTERSIDLLEEKRSALITAAVTGKIDVRAAA